MDAGKRSRSGREVEHGHGSERCSKWLPIAKVRLDTEKWGKMGEIPNIKRAIVRWENESSRPSTANHEVVFTSIGG